ncbi:uncharacterized protein LOC120152944 [Hibiscus syriacus]|uniref:uncharacterized protein LOC120152944 n=1 Tax=Hibiscus syriacus TaxID=106335 RepID=UPI00192176D2|nr:uncharacterized protein LOC120152944 [Hibiscus syriacus]
MAPFETLYGRNCRTPLCWTELSEKCVVGLELIKETEEKVKLIKDWFKVFSWKKVLCFGCKGKLILRFIGPFEVLKRVGPVVYRLMLPPELEHFQDVFHVSILRKYRSDPSHVILVDEVEVHKNLSNEEEHVKILAVDVKVLHNKAVPLVKVLWRNYNTEEATWETEESMRT